MMGVLSLMMIFLLERILPSSRAVKGIELSTQAYYTAGSEIEKALATFNIRNPGHFRTGNDPLGVTFVGSNINTLPFSTNTSTGGYSISETSTYLPESGKGTSEYDKNWNIIAPGRPVQLWIPGSVASSFFSEMAIDFRIPQVKSGANPWEDPATSFSGSDSLAVISWQISNGVETIFPDNLSPGRAFFTVYPDLKDQLTSQFARTSITDFQGRLLSNDKSGLVSTLLNDLSNCVSGCSLKLSTIAPLLSQIGKLPYLEYRIRKHTSGSYVGGSFPGSGWSNMFGYGSNGIINYGHTLSQQIPAQFAEINAVGYAAGFKRTRTQFVDQLTTSDGLDFTIFQ